MTRWVVAEIWHRGFLWTYIAEPGAPHQDRLNASCKISNKIASICVWAIESAVHDLEVGPDSTQIALLALVEKLYRSVFRRVDSQLRAGCTCAAIDDVPWELHKITDWDAYTMTLAAFKHANA